MARSVPPGRLPLLHRVPIPAAGVQLSLDLVASTDADYSAVFSLSGGANLRLGASAWLSDTPPSASRLLDVGMSLST
jgi:hypothetical protein